MAISGTREMYTDSREEELQFLKKLWAAQPAQCPKCGQTPLEHLHKGARKSDCDWKCPACGEIYRTIRMFMELPDR